MWTVEDGKIVFKMPRQRHQRCALGELGVRGDVVAQIDLAANRLPLGGSNDVRNEVE